MKEYWTLIIIGLYTIIYLIVFVVQSSQIKRTKEINESMKSFMDIFKIDEVKKYVELKHESVLMDVNSMLANDKKLREVAREIVMEKNDEIIEMNKKQFGSDHNELIRFCVGTLLNIPKEERQKFIDDGLPLTKRFIQPMIDDVENSKT